MASRALVLPAWGTSRAAERLGSADDRLPNPRQYFLFATPSSDWPRRYARWRMPPPRPASSPRSSRPHHPGIPATLPHRSRRRHRRHAVLGRLGAGDLRLEGPMPLNPIIGACSPVRPDVQLALRDGEIRGRPRSSRSGSSAPRLTPTVASSAMLADQIVSAGSMAIGVRGITKSLQVRYRRPLPLGEEFTLWGVCEPTDDGLQARLTVTVGDGVRGRGNRRPRALRASGRRAATS